MAKDSFTIRRLAPNAALQADLWHAIHALCCLTGNNGRPINTERWDFFPRLWIDPYAKLHPEWTYVAQVKGAVVAYLTGCPDTVRFSRNKLFYCTLPLLMETVLPRYRRNPDARRLFRQALGLEKNAEQCFTRDIRLEIKRKYPAHLHINVDADFRGRGAGRRLIETYACDLRASGIPGVHLYCGPDPVAFYLRVGFQRLGSVTFRGTQVYALGLLIAGSGGTP
jgi:hypothetical protein